MKLLLALLPIILTSCGNQDTLEVRQFHLRTIDPPEDGDAMVRGEIKKRLYGAVTLKERQARRGQYYNAQWQGLSGQEPIRLLFEYRQAATGATVKRLSRTLPPATHGKIEFQITGASYQKQGRVTAWQTTLYEGGKIRDTKRSYLWR